MGGHFRGRLWEQAAMLIARDRGFANPSPEQPTPHSEGIVGLFQVPIKSVTGVEFLLPKELRDFLASSAEGSGLKESSLSRSTLAHFHLSQQD